MRLYMAGLDYGTVPVEARNVCHLSRQQLRNCLTGLFATDGFSNGSPQAHTALDREIIILSTCSRLEVYVATGSAVADCISAQWLLQIQCQVYGDMAHHFTQRQGRGVVEHLLRIASGMELPPLSEPYILEQLMAALAVAQECRTVGPNLARVFQRAIRVGKRAYAEPDTGNRSILLGRAATHLLDQRHPEMANGNLLIVGSSKIAHSAAQVLRDRDPQPTAFIDRTISQAVAVKQDISGQIFPWHQMRTALIWADAVVVAALALHPILDVDDIRVALGQRRARPLLLIDLGLSHNVHPAAAAMQNVIYYDLNDLCVALTDPERLETTCAESLALWMAPLPGLEQMVREEVSILCAWIEDGSSSKDPSDLLGLDDPRDSTNIN